jgi:amino acid transporter
MGAFSSFALAFSLISINTGIFANFQTGIQQVGPAVVWSWLFVLAGQVLVALVLAELVTHYPVSGYGYQWTSRLVHPHYGFFVGWLLLLQFLTGFPGVCATFSDCIRILWNPPISGPVLTVIVIAAVTVIHLLGIRLASLVNDAGVIAEIVGATIIGVIFLIILAPSSEHGLRILADTTNFKTHASAGFSAFALSLLMGAWCLTGFEASADLAEETHRPRQVIPRAMLISLLSSGVGGFLILVGFMLAVKDVQAVQSAPQPLLSIIEGKLGGQVTPIVMCVVLVSIFACAVASMAATSRLIFSLARDNMLPFSHLLKTIQPKRRTPSATIILIGIISSVIVLGLERLALITSISATAGYLGYAGIIAAGLITRRKQNASPGVFSLGAWSTAVRIAALFWTLLLVLALTIPDTGDGHMPAKATTLAFAVGIILYALLIRGRLLRGEAGPPAVGKDEAS